MFMALHARAVVQCVSCVCCVCVCVCVCVCISTIHLSTCQCRACSGSPHIDNHKALCMGRACARMRIHEGVNKYMH